ncbi:hypothetical protein ACFOKJ_05505 [Vogesella amnigena]|uniref:Uncharacterized protein n=1 Tax=Vogesella amnigena TaxID=1507449 RepID=A0ABV7TS70_9NEIS
MTRGNCHTQPPRCHACQGVTRLGEISSVLAFWAQYHCRHARNPHPDPA